MAVTDSKPLEKRHRETIEHFARLNKELPNVDDETLQRIRELQARYEGAIDDIAFALEEYEKAKGYLEQHERELSMLREHREWLDGQLFALGGPNWRDIF